MSVEIEALIRKRGCAACKDIYLAVLRKVSDQTKLGDLFSGVHCLYPARLESFYVGVLNLISDRRALGRIWLDGSVGISLRQMAGDNIVTPSVFFTGISYLYQPHASSDDAIDALAADPVLLERMVSRCCDDTLDLLMHTTRKERVLSKLPAESEAARKLRDVLKKPVA